MLGFRFLADAGSTLSAHRNQAAIKLDYYDFTGKPTPFFRLRLLTEPRSFGAEVAKPLRYVQPPNTGVAAYFPKSIRWPELFADSTKKILITEGEFKAACACKYGFPTIGLGGVYSWRSAKSGLSFLPELEEIQWEGRHAYVVFDSDAQTNHQVMQALRHLCRELTARGALPFVAKLPELADCPKTGMDDFLVRKGAAALTEVLEHAESYGLADELWALNDRVCFVRDPGFVVELATSQTMSVPSFTKEVYANLFYNEQEMTAKGPKLVKRPTAVEWVKWAHRLEAQRLTYKPGEPRFADKELNTWRPSGVEPRAGDISPWVQLLDHLFDGEPTARLWFERWCAYPLRHPGAKLLSAAVLWGVHHGTGKSLVGYSLARLYGESNVSEVTQENLQSPYNDWLVGKQLIMGEEITGSDRRQHADRLKAMITQKVVRVSSKYVREYTVPAVASFFFTSNHPDAFFLEDTDRRFFIHEVRLSPMDLAFYKSYERWYLSEAGAAALLHHLVTLDLVDFSPTAPAFETTSKRDMIDDNKSELAAWVLRLKREPSQVLKECGLPQDAELLTTTQLLAMYDPGDVKKVTTNGLGRELKRSLIPRLQVVKLGETSARLYAIQNVSFWARGGWKPAAVAEHWLKHFGGKR